MVIPEAVSGKAGTAGTSGNVGVSCAQTDESAIVAKYMIIIPLGLHFSPILSQIYRTVRIINNSIKDIKMA